ncbi:BACON domain-containing protein [Bacteroides neonati]|uniref:BACON domain-containing protein n=1 Tax=Bacteroides neonati TaxID=1347393 RepID=UPI0004BB8043|nr:BACON domain-containing carbohydrate-binding protein [Bacteroides neonati]
MAKAAWCTVTPTSGKENGTINISATAHTGRAARTTSVTVQAANGERPSASIAVNQAAAAVATTMDATKPDIPKEGGVVTINGTSNSSKLNWTLGPFINGQIVAIDENGYPVVVKVNSVSITKNTLIAGDPGASAVYSFVATLTAPASPFAVDVPFKFRVTDDSGVSKDCSFTVKAGKSTLSVDKSSLSLVNAGTAQPVAITSNDSWTVS